MRQTHEPPLSRQRGGVRLGAVGVLSASAAMLVWALVAASAVAWGLRVWGQAAGVGGGASGAAAASWEPAVALVSQGLGQRAGAVASGLAMQAVPAPGAERLLLSGIVATGDGGAALISVDGQPARVVRAGRPVADGWTLRSVQAKEVLLVRKGERATLSLPARSGAPAAPVVASQPISTPAAAAPPVPGAALPGVDTSGNPNAQAAR